MFKISKKVAVLFATLCAVLGQAPSARAALSVPQTLTQQGRLLDADGAAVDGVQLTFTFSLYTTAAAGTAVWTETQSITPDNGYFSAKLGEGTAFTANIFDGSQGALYLGIKIGTDAEMAPRQELTSVPFALLALNAVSATHAATADLATKATSATTADTATNATNATNATKATTATSADTVKTIADKVVYKQLGLTNGTVTVVCDAGTVLVGGFCGVSVGYVASSAAPLHSGSGLKDFTCTCAGANCNGIAVASCVK